MRPSTKPNFFEVSDSLLKLKRLFERHDVCSMNERGVQLMCDELGRLYNEARRLENEVSAKRWNEQGKANDMSRTAAVVKAAATGNVVLFPAAFRAAFSDGPAIRQGMKESAELWGGVFGTDADPDGTA